MPRGPQSCEARPTLQLFLATGPDDELNKLGPTLGATIFHREDHSTTRSILIRSCCSRGTVLVKSTAHLGRTGLAISSAGC